MIRRIHRLLQKQTKARTWQRPGLPKVRPFFPSPMRAILIILGLCSLTSLRANEKMGQQQFLLCGACHGQGGEGTAAGPPLSRSEWVNGPPENLIRIQLRGLIGPIPVKGVTYDFPSGMPPMAYQTDEQIAAVLTHVRSSFGNNSPAVSAAQVAALRSEVVLPQLTQADLLPPERKPASTAASGTNQYDSLDERSARSPSILVYLLTLAAGVAVGLIFLFKRKKDTLQAK